MVLKLVVAVMLFEWKFIADGQTYNSFSVIKLFKHRIFSCPLLLDIL